VEGTERRPWGRCLDWAVVTQQLGVRPFLNYGALQVVPQVPQDQPSIAGSNILLGQGSLDVFASHRGNRYLTKMQVHRLHLRSMMIGQTLPLGSSPRSVPVDAGRAKRVPSGSPAVASRSPCRCPAAASTRWSSPRRRVRRLDDVADVVTALISPDCAGSGKPIDVEGALSRRLSYRVG
jgi:hypothetical protein